VRIWCSVVKCIRHSGTLCICSAASACLRRGRSCWCIRYVGCENWVYGALECITYSRVWYFDTLFAASIFWWHAKNCVCIRYIGCEMYTWYFDTLFAVSMFLWRAKNCVYIKYVGCEMYTWYFDILFAASIFLCRANNCWWFSYVGCENAYGALGRVYVILIFMNHSAESEEQRGLVTQTQQIGCQNIMYTSHTLHSWYKSSCWRTTKIYS